MVAKLQAEGFEVQNLVEGTSRTRLGPTLPPFNWYWVSLLEVR
jgi:hypothetical protein